MKGYFLLIAVFLAAVAVTVSSPLGYEDESEQFESFRSETAQAPRRYRRSEKCNFNECDQFCRRLKLPGGACIGDKCDCDRF